MKTKLILFLIANLLSSAAVAAVQVVEFPSAAGSVTFQAIGRPAAIKINGTGDAPKGQLTVKDQTLSGVLTFNLSSLKTGIDLRDRHMKEKYLQVDQYPEAHLTIEKLVIPPTLFTDLKGEAKQIPFKGKLKIKKIRAMSVAP